MRTRKFLHLLHCIPIVADSRGRVQSFVKLLGESICFILLGSCLSIYRHSTQICLRPKETCFFVLVVCVYLDHTPEIILHILLERLLKCVFAQQHFVAFGSLFRL